MDQLFDLSKFSELVTGYAPMVLGAIVTIIIGFWLAGVLTRFVRRLMEKNGVDKSVVPFLSSIVSVGFKIMVLIAAASMFGIKTTSFIAIFGALTLAIGMALQGSLGHFASGVLLLTFKPYKVGDLVEIGGGKTGVVEEIQVFNTVLSTLDNKRIIIPNGVVTNNVITNISGQGTVGVELAFDIGHQADIDKARSIILDVGKECPHVLDDPAQGVVVAAVGENGTKLASRPFCKSENYWDTLFYMQENIKKRFVKEGIAVPMSKVQVDSSVN